MPLVKFNGYSLSLEEEIPHYYLSTLSSTIMRFYYDNLFENDERLRSPG